VVAHVKRLSYDYATNECNKLKFEDEYYLGMTGSSSNLPWTPIIKQQPDATKTEKITQVDYLCNKLLQPLK